MGAVRHQPLCFFFTRLSEEFFADYRLDNITRLTRTLFGQHFPPRPCTSVIEITVVLLTSVSLHICVVPPLVSFSVFALQFSSTFINTVSLLYKYKCVYKHSSDRLHFFTVYFTETTVARFSKCILLKTKTKKACPLRISPTALNIDDCLFLLIC